MKGRIRTGAAVVAVAGLAVAMATPAAAQSREAKARKETTPAIQLVDDEDDNRDPRVRDYTWTDNTGPSRTNAFTRSGQTRPGQTNVTRDWTRSVDFTRDLTNTNTNTKTPISPRGR